MHNNTDDPPVKLGMRATFAGMAVKLAIEFGYPKTQLIKDIKKVWCIYESKI